MDLYEDLDADLSWSSALSLDGGTEYDPFWSLTGERKIDLFDRCAELLTEVSELMEIIGPLNKTGYPPIGDYSVHAEVGDDHVCYTMSPLQFAMEIVISTTYLGIETSMKDTFISSYYGNFSESILLKPMNKSEAWVKADLHTGVDLPFMDLSKLRTCLPVVSMRQKHSDTLEGKVALQAKTYAFATKLNKLQCGLAGAFQYLSLNLFRDRKFPYLPDFLGGLGGSVLGTDHFRQFCRGTAQFKNGGYAPLIYHISRCVERLINGRKEDMRFLSSINHVTQHWRTWFNFYSKYIPRIGGSLPLDVESYSVGNYGSDRNWDQAVARCVAAGYLVTESQLLVHQRNADLTRGLLSVESLPDFKELLRMERENQKSLTIFSKSFMDSWNDRIQIAQLEIPTESSIQSLLLLLGPGGREAKASLRRDPIYLSEAMDHIYATGPLKVDVQMQIGGKALPIYFDPCLDDTEREHFDQLLSWVKKPSGYPPRELIEDDPVLIDIATEFMEETIQLVGMTPVIYLVSQDVRLGKAINMRTSLPVRMIHPSTDRRMFAQLMGEDRHNHPTIVGKLLVDTGSVFAARSKAHGRKTVIGRAFSRMFPRRLILGTTQTDGIFMSVDHFGRLPQTQRRRGNWRINRRPRGPPEQQL